MTEFRVAVCGGVGWTDATEVAEVLDALLEQHGRLVVLTGMADGADAIARSWACARGLDVWAECLAPGAHPAPMHAYNHRLLAREPDLVVAFKNGFDPDARPAGHEPGTEHLVRLARQAAVPVRLYGTGRLARTVKPPNRSVASETDVAVFLAGSIDQGAAVDWQAEVEDALRDLDIVILNPRRDRWDASLDQSLDDPVFAGQLAWEHAGLERSDLILLYLAPDSLAPVSLIELGVYAGTGKLHLCCPDGFWRKGNVDHVARIAGLTVHATFDEWIVTARSRIEAVIARGHPSAEARARSACP